MQTKVLEESRNPHVLEVSNGQIELSEITNNVSYVRVKEEKGSPNMKKVVHGEHGTLGIESDYVVKSIQQELNPITKAFQKAFD